MINNKIGNLKECSTEIFVGERLNSYEEEHIIRPSEFNNGVVMITSIVILQMQSSYRQTAKSGLTGVARAAGRIQRAESKQGDPYARFAPGRLHHGCSAIHGMQDVLVTCLTRLSRFQMETTRLIRTTLSAFNQQVIKFVF